MRGKHAAAGLVVSVLLSQSAPAIAAGGDEPAPSPEQVERAFERFQGLAGEWRARSTKGWTGRAEYRLLGRGTVVMAISSFDDAPPERDMASAIHLDGGRLLLTHYCEAGNQPRLVATRISPDAREVEFEFLDGTGMASRDEGHMDRAIFRFLDGERYTSRWTWYRGGEEGWMEEIIHVRGSAAAPEPAGTGSEGSR